MQTRDASTAFLATAEGSIFVGILGKGIVRLDASSLAQK